MQKVQEQNKYEVLCAAHCTAARDPVSHHQLKNVRQGKWHKCAFYMPSLTIKISLQSSSRGSMAARSTGALKRAALNTCKARHKIAWYWCPIHLGARNSHASLGPQAQASTPNRSLLGLNFLGFHCHIP